MKQKILQMNGGAGVLASLLLVCASARAQVNSGSNGSDGAFNPATNTVINMADHPNGIYQYTSVTISNGVTVTFIPNANNSPVTWLVQNNVVINGTLDVSGQNGYNAGGTGAGGPGGGRGGNGGNQATSGQGLGGGSAGCPANPGIYTYGNTFLIPLLGGSGGGGYSCNNFGGGGGGGALLIAVSNTITVNGNVLANGGYNYPNDSGPGSGGAIRLVASKIIGSGIIGAYGNGPISNNGRIRFDTFENDFSGTVGGNFSQGYQPIIIPTSGQGTQLAVTSVGGVPVSASPTGVLSTPDAVVSAQQNNPIPVVVSCSNLPLNTLITVTVKPSNGSPVSATGYNTTGTQSSSTATISISIPRAGGLIYATAATGN
jgi:hypothetical protein